MKKSFIILALLVFFSCNQEVKKGEQLEQSRIIKVEEIKSKYGVKYSMTNLLDFDYSYQFNEVLKADKQLLEYYRIHDIYTKNNQNYVKLKIHNYHFDLLLEDDSVLKALLDDVDSRGYSESRNMLIIKLDEVKKIDFLVDVYDDSYEDETAFIIDITESEKFIGKGKILELIKR